MPTASNPGTHEAFPFFSCTVFPFLCLPLSLCQNAGDSVRLSPFRKLRINSLCLPSVVDARHPLSSLVFYHFGNSALCLYCSYLPAATENNLCHLSASGFCLLPYFCILQVLLFSTSCISLWVKVPERENLTAICIQYLGNILIMHCYGSSQLISCWPDEDGCLWLKSVTVSN